MIWDKPAASKGAAANQKPPAAMYLFGELCS